MSFPRSVVATDGMLTRPFTVARVGLHRYTLLALLLISFVAVVTLLAPTDPDVWWHLRNGQLILASGVPTTDVYSFTASGRPWIVQEWLTEVGTYAVQSVFGYGVLSLLFGLLQALGSGIVYLLLRRAGAGRILALVLLMLYMVFAAPSWGVRPQVLTPIFLGSFYLVLLAYKNDRSRTRLLWILPPLMLLWTNMHASYFMGIALVGAFMVGEAANNFVYRPAYVLPIRPLVLTLAGCLLATLVNPYFIELWTYPLTYVTNGTANPLLKYTQEWQSPDFHEPGNLLFGATLVALVLVGVSRYKSASVPAQWRFGIGRNVDISLALLVGAFTLLALQAVRMVPVYGLIVLPVLAAGLARYLPALSAARDTEIPLVEGRANIAFGVLGTLVMLILIWRLPQAQTGAVPRTDTSIPVPVEAVTYLGGVPSDAHIYNDFRWGGYMIYKLYPAHRVFIDGRADMYRVGVFEDSVRAEGASAGWPDVFAKYKIDYALTATGGPLDLALARQSGWSQVYRDGLAVVYAEKH